MRLLISFFRKANKMKSNIRLGLKVFWSACIAIFMCFFIYISIFTIFTIGADATYAVYQVADDGTIVKDADGNDVVLRIENDVPEFNKNETYIKVFDRSGATEKLQIALQQFFMLLTFIIVIGKAIADTAYDDRNATDFTSAAYDKQKGLKIGLFAVIPFVLIYLLLIVSKIVSFEFYGVFTFLNLPFKPYMNLITNNATTIADVSWVAIAAFSVILLAIPLICFVTYRLAFNQDSLVAKLIYKSKQPKGKK